MIVNENNILSPIIWEQKDMEGFHLFMHTTEHLRECSSDTSSKHFNFDFSFTKANSG